MPLETLRDELAGALATARTLGLGTLVMPAPPPAMREMDGEGYAALGRELGAIARRVADEGLRLAYHNHHWEMAGERDGTGGSDRTGGSGRTKLDALFEAAGEAPLDWECDAAWLARGGADPRAVVARHGARLTIAHLKDLAPRGEAADEDGWADVGHGTMDWAALLPVLLEGGAELLFTEHDKPSDGARFARRSRDFVLGLPA